MRYPEAINLPFNSHAMKDLYVPAKPGEPDGGEPGCWTVVREDCMVFQSKDGGFGLPEGKLPDSMKEGGEEVLIGKWKNKPLRLLRIGNINDLPSGFSAEPLLMLFLKGKMDDGLLTVAGLAQQIARWETNSEACPRCGKRTERIAGSWGKHCSACAFEHFPCVHPCAIALVTRGDLLLMIRKPEWPEGYYSLPSGFCDFGECLEECVVREVEEETGIRVRNMRYLGSQSWPFPSQLMAAFAAEYESGEINVDVKELEDARWFRRDAMPPTFSDKSIAGWMIRKFASQSI
ncbi:MAG TPA: NAD(+) diphosphatase [Geobacteraceae bacterium]|nr:NAD(+) diphosphatase [Geobacteraceae bacterium]